MSYLDSILLVNLYGKVLFRKEYRVLRESVSSKKKKSLVEKIFTESSVMKVHPPISITRNGKVFFFIKIQNIYMVGFSSRKNYNLVLGFQTLNHIKEVLEKYFVPGFDENVIEDNIFELNEIFNELIESGYPQKYGKFEQFEEILITERPPTPPPETLITRSVTGFVNWRQMGIKYIENDLHISISEEINVLFGRNSGNVPVFSEIVGKVVMRSRLSDMPNIRIGFNDRLVIEDDRFRFRRISGRRFCNNVHTDDVKFHRCVRLGNLAKKRFIEFVPPDGEFELMSYKVANRHRSMLLPFRFVSGLVRQTRLGMVEFEVALKSQFFGFYDGKLPAKNVIVKIPIFSEYSGKNSKVNVKVTNGSVEFDGKNIVWKIARFHYNKMERISGSVDGSAESVNEGRKRSRIENNDERSRIKMSFQIDGFTASQFRIKFLRVTGVEYTAKKSVGYKTVSDGKYELRI